LSNGSGNALAKCCKIFRLVLPENGSQKTKYLQLVVFPTTSRLNGKYLRKETRYNIIIVVVAAAAAIFVQH